MKLKTHLTKRLMKDFLSMVLTIALILSVVVIAVSAEDTTGTDEHSDTLEEPDTEAIIGTGSITITVFEELGGDITAQKVPADTPLKELVLPDTLKAFCAESAAAAAASVTIEGITWQPDRTYDSAAGGEFNFTAVLPEGYVLADQVALPQIRVVIADKTTEATLGEPYDIENGLTLRGEDGCSQDSSHVITGSTIKSQLFVESGTHYIVLDHATLDLRNAEGVSPFELQSGAEVRLVLKDHNVLIGGAGASGLRVPGGSSLTISDGKGGSLAAEGGSGAAGIGSDGSHPDCGAVTIESGSVSAFAGQEWPMGMGGDGAVISVNGGALDAISASGTGIGGEGVKLSVMGGTVNASGSGSQLEAPSGRPQSSETEVPAVSAAKSAIKSALQGLRSGTSDSPELADYNTSDIDVIKKIVKENGLVIPEADKEKPWNWDFAQWLNQDDGSGKRITELNIDGQGLKGTLDVTGLSKLYRLNCASNELSNLNIQGLSELVSLNCNNNKLAKLNLEDFSKLSQVYCNSNGLTNLTLRNCPELNTLECKDNWLAKLDLIGAPKLKTFDCSRNKLTSLDVKDLSFLNYFTFSYNELTEITLPKSLVQADGEGNKLKAVNFAERMDNLFNLKFDNNNLTSLDLTNAPALSYLYALNNQITEIDLSESKEMSILILDTNKLKSLDLTMMTKLTYVSVGNNQLTSLDVAGLSNLETVIFNYNEITEFELTGNASLKSLEGTGNKLKTLELSNQKSLKTIRVIDNQLTSLDVTDLERLSTLYCAENKLTEIDLSANKELTELGIGKNKLRTVNLDGLSKLRYLTVEENYLTDVDLSNCPELNSIECWGNLLTRVDTSNCPDLRTVYCSSNQITSLDFSGNPKLSFLSCEYNQLTDLNLTGLNELQNVECGNNLFTSLNISDLPKLENVLCESGKLESLSLMNLPLLRSVKCSQNAIASLKLVNLPRLSTLYCNSNQLTSLDLSGAPNLKQLDCRNNKFSGESKIIGIDLNNITSFNFAPQDVVNESGSGGTDESGSGGTDETGSAGTDKTGSAAKIPVTGDTTIIAAWVALLILTFGCIGIILIRQMRKKKTDRNQQ